jgi:colanic acid/amylovoran biosynthesis protein
MRVTLVNCWHDDNKGDSAIVLGTLKALQACTSDLSIRLVSIFSEQSPLFLNASRHILKKFPNAELKGSSIPDASEVNRWRWLAALAQSVNPLKVKKNLKLLDGVDLVISVGGHYFVTYGGPGDLLRIYAHSYPLLLAWRARIPFAIYGQSIGPLHSSLSRHFIRMLFQKALFIGVRELLSKEELVRCDLPPGHIHLLPDLAFMIEPSLTERVTRLLQRYGLKPSDFVVITPRQWFKKGDFRYIAYLDALATLIHYLRVKGLKIVIFAHTLGPTPFEDDRVACNDLLKKLPYYDGIYYVEEDLDPEELSAFYGYSRLVVGTRFHSIILSFTAGTPAFALSYSGPKAPGIMDLFGFRSYTADISNLHPKTLQAGVEHLLHNEHNLREQIVKKVAELRANIINSTQEMLRKVGVI